MLLGSNEIHPSVKAAEGRFAGNKTKSTNSIGLSIVHDLELPSLKLASDLPLL